MTYVVPLCDGGAVVVDEETLAGALLNPVAAFVLARLRAGESDLERLVDAVAAEFDAPRDTIRRDVERFLAGSPRLGSGLHSTLYGNP